MLLFEKLAKALEGADNELSYTLHNTFCGRKMYSTKRCEAAGLDSEGVRGRQLSRVDLNGLSIGGQRNISAIYLYMLGILYTFASLFFSLLQRCAAAHTEASKRACASAE